MSDYELTAGSIEAINSQDDESSEQGVSEPIFQVLSCKKLQSQGGGQDRYRIIVSDGVHYMQGMLASSLNGIAASGELDKFAIIRADSHACNAIQGRKIMILLGLTVLGRAEGRIGEPSAMGTPNPQAGGAQQQQQQPQAKTEPKQENQSTGGAPARNGMVARAAPNKPAASTASNKSGTSRSGGSNTGFPIYPIEGLSPYQNKWTIKARVSSKTDVKHWSNARGDGKLFNVTLMDDSGEIRATGFNQQVDQFFDVLQENKAYYISKARVNIAKKQFNNVNNEYELSLGNDTEISVCEDAEDVPALRFNFVELGNIAQVEKDQTCDVIGVVKDVSEVSTIVAKATQRVIPKREVSLVDRSGFSIRLTLWGKTAEEFSAPDQPVIAFRGVKVGDFGGRSLSMVSSSTMMTEPDIQEAHELRGWYDNQGAHSDFQTYTSSSVGASGGAGAFRPHEFRTVQQARDEGLGHGESPDYFNLRATIVFLKNETLSYPACPTDRCNKKVVKEDDNAWRCEKCEKVHEAPEYRYVLSMSVGDYTGQCWLSAFNDVGKLLIGSSADEMESLRENDEALFRNKVQKGTGRLWEFACRAKSDTFNDQVKVKYQILQARPINFEAACKDLVDKIAKYGILD